MAARQHGVLDRLNHLLSGRERRRVGEVLGERLSCDRHAVTVQESALEQVLHQGRRSAHAMKIFLDILTARLQVGQQRHAVAGALEVVQRQRDVRCFCDRHQVEHRVGGSPQRHDHRQRVLERLAREDVERLEIALEQGAHGRPGTTALLRLPWVLRRERRAVRQRQSERLNRHRHRVGGVHAAARAGARTRVPDDVEPLFIGNETGEKFAIRLEGRDDVARLAKSLARANRPAVHHQRGTVQPGHRDHGPGHVLVAAGHRDERVVPLGAHDRFDRIGDQVARRKRVAHALGPHRDAVADPDRIEAKADQTRALHAVLDVRGKPIEVHVAGVALVPHATDADLRLLQVRIGQAGAVQHGLGRTLAAGLGDAGGILVHSDR